MITLSQKGEAEQINFKVPEPQIHGPNTLANQLQQAF